MKYLLDTDEPVRLLNYGMRGGPGQPVKSFAKGEKQ